MGPPRTPKTGGGIERIIHQIWLGTNPRPVEWMDSVRDFATANHYTYKLWDEATAAKELPWDSVPGLRRLYEDFGDKLAGKADLIRLLALHELGGIYIDADSVVMKPAKFADFLETNKHPVFFAWEELRANGRGLENAGPELAGQDHRLIANGTIGAQAHHPFLRSMLERVVEHATVRETEDPWRRVGPLFVTRMYWTRPALPGVADVHIYPMKLFYPLHWHGIKDPELHKKVKIPGESMLFQYGYTTNGFADIFRRRAAGIGGGARKKSQRVRSKRVTKRVAKRSRTRLSGGLRR